MSKITEVSGAGANTNIVASGGVNELGIIGAYKSVFFAETSHKFDSILAAKTKSNWDADATANGEIVYLGSGKFEDQSEEAQNFTDAALNIDEETVAATKALRLILQVNAVVHAELKKMAGKSGRFFIQTKNSFLKARLEDDGDVVGLQGRISSVTRTVANDDTPVEYTYIDFNFTDNEGDEVNPAELKLDFLFSEVDQVYPLTATVDNVSSNGSQLDFDLDIDQAGSNSALSGVLQGQFTVEDVDGNVLPIASFSEGSGVYSFGVTTALTEVYVKFNGRQQVASVYYFLDSVQAAA